MCWMDEEQQHPPRQEQYPPKKRSLMEEYLDALPRPIRGVLQFLLLDLIDPTDSSSQILRKIVVTAGACMFVHPVSYIGYFGYLIAQGAPVTGPACLIVACCFSMLSWLLVYLIARQLRDVPDLLLDAWLVGTNIAFSLLIISMPQYPATTCIFASAILTILCNSPRRTFHLAWCALLYLLKEYNDATAGSGYEGLVPGARYGPLAESLINHMSGFFIAFTVLMSLLIQTKEYIRTVESSQAAVSAARVMAKQLAHYDTVAVRQTISDELSRGQIDLEFLDAFSGIADNLERYRPHLPNWMVHVAKTPTDPDLASVSIGSRGSNRSEKATLRSAASGDGGAAAPTDSSSCAETPDQAHIHRPMSASTNVHAPGSSHQLRLVPNKASLVHRTRVVLAQVRVTAISSAAPNTAATDQLIGEVLALADATQASLHSFICDDIVLSWSATHRVAQPEVKAARLLAKLRAVVTSRPSIAAHLRISAAAVSTDAISRFAGVAGGQCTLHVSVPDRARTALRVLADLAAAHDAVVVDGVIGRLSAHDIVSREIEALSIPGGKTNYPRADSRSRSPASPPSVSPSADRDLLLRSPDEGSPLSSPSPLDLQSVVIAAEVLSERAHALDEWMYVMEKADKDASAELLVSQALRKALASDFDEAQRLIAASIAASATPSTLLERLRQRITQAAASASGRRADLAPFALDVKPHVC